jgi:hypothetical protein
MRRRRLRTRPLLAAVIVLMWASVAPPVGGAEAWVPPAVFAPYQAYPVGSWAESVAVADFTGDGRNDIAMSTSEYADELTDHKVFLFVQQTGGALANQARYDTNARLSGIISLAAGDLNGDGRADLTLATGDGIPG